MSGDIGIGKLIECERFRDAIHIAVAPVEAGEILWPGARVGLVDGKAMKIEPHIGIVDPFLTGVILRGQRFYLFLFPGTITSLRHEWVHPAFEAQKPAPEKPTSDKAVSEAWLRQYACRVNPYIVDEDGDEEAYQALMRDMRSGQLVYHGVEMHSVSELIDGEELKKHTEIVLGIKIDYSKFEYFSCTC